MYKKKKYVKQSLERKSSPQKEIFDSFYLKEINSKMK